MKRHALALCALLLVAACSTSSTPPPVTPDATPRPDTGGPCGDGSHPRIGEPCR